MEKIDKLIQRYTNILNNSRPNMLDDPFSRGEDAGTARVSSDIISDLKQLKQSRQQTKPAPIVVPEFVAKWYEENKHDLDYKIWVYIYDFDSQDRSEFSKWANNILNNPIETLIRMKDGYTVEKEPLYYVKVGNLVFVDWRDGFVAELATTDNLEWPDYAHKIPTKKGADRIAKIIGGEVVPVKEESQ